jgi:hypothetical protein
MRIKVILVVFDFIQVKEVKMSLQAQDEQFSARNYL